MEGTYMGERRQLVRRMEKAMDFPGGTLAKTALIEMEGNRRLVVAGCRGVLGYTEDCVQLRIPEGTLLCYGRDLEMGCLTADEATVVGCLQRIEFAD